MTVISLIKILEGVVVLFGLLWCDFLSLMGGIITGLLERSQQILHSAGVLDISLFVRIFEKSDGFPAVT